MKQAQWLLVATIACGLASPACTKEAPRPATHPDVAKPRSTPSKAAGSALLPLVKLEAVDATPAESRPNEFQLDVEAEVTRAAYGKGGFSRGTPGAADGCGLSVNLVYVITANKRVVRQAGAGEARASVGGELHCQRDDALSSFRAEVELVETFDTRAGATGVATLKRVVAAVMDTVVHQLVGQTRLRGADDSRVLETLAKGSHVGELMEAALEAGERKLTGAIPHLVSLTRHEHPNVAMRAAAALGLLKASGDEVVQALVAMTRGANLEKHLVAVNTLGDLKAPSARRYLEAIAEGHPEEAIRLLAREAADRNKKSGSDASEVAP